MMVFGAQFVKQQQQVLREISKQRAKIVAEDKTLHEWIKPEMVAC